MRRREFIKIIGGAAASWPLAAHSQQGPARIALLGTGADGTTGIFVEALKEGMAEQGLLEGRDYLLDTRWAEGVYDRFPPLVEELLTQQPRAILVETFAAVRAAQNATRTPIVMIAVNDPVGTGLIASLARPGGHTTGSTNLNEDVTPKLLEMVQATVPQAKLIAALLNPNSPSARVFLGRVTAEVARFNMSVRPIDAKTSRELPEAFGQIAGINPGAVIVMPDQIFLDGHKSLAKLALQHRLALFSTIPEMTEAGALLSYGVVRRALYRRTAYFIKRILDGANPGDLPVEQPTRIELAINLKTASALGIPISDALLARADRTFE